MRTGANNEYTLSLWQSPDDPITSDMFDFHIDDAMGKLFPDTKSEVRRLVTGTYDGKDEVYRRPLTKKIYDVNDQLDGIKKKPRP